MKGCGIEVESTVRHFGELSAKAAQALYRTRVRRGGPELQLIIDLLMTAPKK